MSPRKLSLSLALFATLAGGPAVAAEEPGVRVFETVKGERYAPFEDKSVRALVVVFISTDCPVANYFQPTLRRLGAKHREAGVRFVMVHPDPGVSAEAARKHAEEYSVEAPVALDPKFEMASRLAAEYTPEAVLVDRGGKVHYQGRVNDMYVSWGKKRRAPKREDLDIAIGEFLKGAKVSVPKTEPVGCYIPFPTEPKEKSEP